MIITAWKCPWTQARLGRANPAALAASNAMCVTHAARGLIRGGTHDVTGISSAAGWLTSVSDSRISGVVCFDEMQVAKPPFLQKIAGFQNKLMAFSLHGLN